MSIRKSQPDRREQRRGSQQVGEALLLHQPPDSGDHRRPVGAVASREGRQVQAVVDATDVPGVGAEWLRRCDRLKSLTVITSLASRSFRAALPQSTSAWKMSFAWAVMLYVIPAIRAASRATSAADRGEVRVQMADATQPDQAGQFQRLGDVAYVGAQQVAQVGAEIAELRRGPTQLVPQLAGAQRGVREIGDRCPQLGQTAVETSIRRMTERKDLEVDAEPLHLHELGHHEGL